VREHADIEVRVVIQHANFVSSDAGSPSRGSFWMNLSLRPPLPIRLVEHASTLIGADVRRATMRGPCAARRWPAENLGLHGEGRVAKSAAG